MSHICLFYNLHLGLIFSLLQDVLFLDASKLLIETLYFSVSNRNIWVILFRLLLQFSWSWSWNIDVHILLVVLMIRYLYFLSIIFFVLLGFIVLFFRLEFLLIFRDKLIEHAWEKTLFSFLHWFTLNWVFSLTTAFIAVWKTRKDWSHFLPHATFFLLSILNKFRLLLVFYSFFVFYHLKNAFLIQAMRNRAFRNIIICSMNMLTWYI